MLTGSMLGFTEKRLRNKVGFGVGEKPAESLMGQQGTQQVVGPINCSTIRIRPLFFQPVLIFCLFSQLLSVFFMNRPQS